jgi:alpha-L-fucosidase 2
MDAVVLLKRLAIVCLAVAALALPASAAAPRLYYDTPANPRVWEEALPLGNGRLGAMIFGGTASERIQFNEDTLWTGKPHDYVREGSGAHLARLRELTAKELTENDPDAKSLGDLVRRSWLSDPVRQKMYQPFGDLRFDFSGHDAAVDYTRDLDLDRAVAGVRYRVGSVRYKREVFASHPDGLIVVRLSSSEAGKLSFRVRMDSPHRMVRVRRVDDRTLAMSGQVEDPVDQEPGLTFESRLVVEAPGATVRVGDDNITVDGATNVTLRLAAATSFVSWQDISGNPAARCEAALTAASGFDADQLFTRHVADHQKLFRAMSFELGDSKEVSVPTDGRLRAVNKDETALDRDPGLVALYMQMGRYMLIASSRPGDQAANLQGVWNELMNPPWESKYTTNINLQMNYWPAEVTNLGETHEPLFSLLDDVRVSGARTARAMYGARGFVLHHNTDLWRGTAPINNVDGVWPTGGAWLCWHVWERFLFTRDEAFLRERAYPVMKDACLFLIDTLVVDAKTGWLVTSPSHSPEQPPRGRALFSVGPTMDMQLVRSLFRATLEASERLDTDHDFAAELRSKLKQLAPNQVGQHGQLQEWIRDWDSPGNNHRHMSPLWGVYPGDDITPADERTWNAAMLLLKWRGDGSTGWSYGWRIPLWARAQDGEFALRQLRLQLAKRTFPNLFDKCGPFQVDGNFGATAGIAEMLLQSHQRIDRDTHLIDLLPALPKSWREGSITGLRARGGFEVSLWWKDGTLTRAVIRSEKGLPCRVRYGETTADLSLHAGESVELNASLKR